MVFAREQGVSLTTLFEDADFQALDSLRAKALHTGFNHAASEGKSSIFGYELERYVEREFPEQFRILNTRFPKKLAPLAMPVHVQGDEAGPSTIGAVEAFQLKWRGR